MLDLFYSVITECVVQLRCRFDAYYLCFLFDTEIE
jgi:hypothetical protein